MEQAHEILRKRLELILGEENKWLLDAYTSALVSSIPKPAPFVLNRDRTTPIIRGGVARSFLDEQAGRLDHEGNDYHH